MAFYTYVSVYDTKTDSFKSINAYTDYMTDLPSFVSFLGLVRVYQHN